MILHLHFLQRVSLVLFVLLLASPPFLRDNNYYHIVVATTAQELTSAFPSDQPSLGPSVAAVSSSSFNDTNTGSVAPTSPAPIYSPSPVSAMVNTTSSSTSSDTPSLSPLLLQLSTNPSSSPTDATDINPDIINGVDADYGEYPFFAWPFGFGTCGGTLIHEDIVLTAAHCECSTFDPVNGVVINIGGTERSGFGAIDSIRAFGCHPHPQFNNVTHYNDIMLIVLETPSKAPTVTLNTDKTVPKTDDFVTVIGYGYAVSLVPESIQDFLQEVTVKVQPEETCDVEYQFDASEPISELNFDFVPEEQICTFGDGLYASCKGDSGGPLLTANNEQIGIVSYGRGDCEIFPTVFIEVAAYAEWIQQGICKYSLNPPNDCPDVPTSPTPYPTPDPTYEPTPYPVNTGECEDYGKGMGGKGKGTMKCKKGMKRPKEPKTPKTMKDKKDMKMGKMGKMGKKGYDDDYN